MKLKIATCQFPVDRDVERNCGFVLQQMASAKKRGADVVHFCETCLSGYAGIEFPSFTDSVAAMLPALISNAMINAAR